MRGLLAFCFLAATPLSAQAQDITLAAPPGELHGTLLTAAKKAPAILIIAGSGATDRDGNNVAGLRTNMYKMLAEGLASKGISSLRYDKRGVGASKQAMIAPTDLRIQTYADDATAMAAQLREHTGTSCVWLLGHSEGALLAELAAQKPVGLCGLILVSGVGQKLGPLIREQLEANPANPADLKQAADAIITSLEAGHPVTNVPPLLAPLFRPDIQPFLMSEISLDPAALLAGIRLPVFILQGDTDIQVSLTDAKLLAGAKPDAKLTVLPGVNHLLKLAPRDRSANIATYSDPSLPLAPGLVDAIADFVHEHQK